jgi:WD40 repeat protein
MCMLHRFKLHKVLIQDLSFSADEQFLASLGGQDDNQLVIWDIQTGKALVGHPVGMNVANKIQFFNNTNCKLLTIHYYGLRLWTVDLVAKKILYTDIQMGTMKRVYQCVCIDSEDKYALFGTHTGDIVEISLDNLLFKRVGPAKRLFSKGINTIRILSNNDIMVGAGDGTIAKVTGSYMTVKQEAKVMGGVTSISLTADNTHLFAGTNKSTIYWCNTDTIDPELRNTCHYEKINDISFPSGYSDLFATCSINDIRVWNASTR